MSHDVDIVVIGAGAAGIGAMRVLTDQGISCLLLEASQRVGGRAYTTAPGQGLALDLGCGWLHSTKKNSWVNIAESMGQPIDRRETAWGKQYKDLGFSSEEQNQARRTLSAWNTMMQNHPPASDSAADAALMLPDEGRWRTYVEQTAAAYTGKPLEQISVVDYLAYRTAEKANAAEEDWRLPDGFGHLVAASLPANALLHLATPVTKLTLEAKGVGLFTPRGCVRARAAIVTVSTNVLSNGVMALPSELEPWKSAAADLSLGINEKIFLEILDQKAYELETRVLSDPRVSLAGAYYIRPLGMPVIEGFFGGEAASHVVSVGPAAAFDLALNQLAKLFGSKMCQNLRPLTFSSWRTDRWIQGGYSCAVPGRHSARARLAQSYDDRVFFAGEATHLTAFSTAHGALDTGIRAAHEAIKALDIPSTAENVSQIQEI